jgi:DNA-directed RNA polymerase specialized sigma24 family protein
MPVGKLFKINKIKLDIYKDIIYNKNKNYLQERKKLMKSSTYKKNGNGKINNNTLKMGEIVMKSSTYKKVDGKVIKIDNKNNKLEDFNPESFLMECYNKLFNLITSGSNVTPFVKTKEFKESLQESLQDTLLKMIENKEYENHSNIAGLLRKNFYNRTLDKLRSETTYEIFKRDFSEYCQDSSYGVTKEFLNDMLIAVKTLLTISEYKLFKLYHIQGLTIEKITVKLDTNYSQVHRSIQWINSKIEKLNFNVCFDNRYVAHFSGKKKRQHKRKILTHKECIDLSGKINNIDTVDYTPTSTLERYNLDLHKLPYNSKQGGYKDITLDQSSYLQIASGGYSYNANRVIIQNVYSDSGIMPTNEIKESRCKAYRRKRYARIYKRNLKVFKAKENKERNLKNGRYLNYLND